jgi:phosphoenolpyruvate synthase/pyruvate phosphate dikinase
MVYGNKTEYDSGSGVYITRNPITGMSDIPYGEFAYNVIGE